MEISARGILLDIEGTTSSIQYVYEVLFPYARTELEPFLTAHWEKPDVQDAVGQIATDAGHNSAEAWLNDLNPGQQQTTVVREVIRQMDADLKATGLKTLQGLIWQAGFDGGVLKAHLFDDVLPAIQNWHQQGCDIRIYSSGSIAAQKLFFGHTGAGNLLPYFNGHYDTTTGPKTEAASYRKIAADYACEPAEILFISDVVAELDAASAAGLQTVLSIRPGNLEQHGNPHAAVRSFREIQVEVNP